MSAGKGHIMPGTLGPLEPEPQRLGDAVYERIGEAIIERRLEPGQRIRDIDIAAELGVSRMPVREALQRLERIGLVEMSASRYTRVTEISDAEIRASLEYLGYQVGIAMRMAADRMDDDDRARAVALTRAVVARCRSTEPTDVLDVPVEAIIPIYEDLNTLYAFVTEACGNAVFTRAYNEAWFGLRRAQRGKPHLIQTPAATAEAFDRLAIALDGRDCEGAEQIIREMFLLTEVGATST